MQDGQADDENADAYEDLRTAMQLGGGPIPQPSMAEYPAGPEEVTNRPEHDERHPDSSLPRWKSRRQPAIHR
jgi:hypothetical protein